MTENVIFCFSGTGNCLDLAKTIASGLGDTDIIMLRKDPAVTDVTYAKRVGFVFPCHGGGLPVGLEEKFKMLRVSPEAYTFGVSQSASYVGIGLSKLNSVIPLDFWAATTHQCSCIWLFPHTMMLPPMSAGKAQHRSEETGRLIAAQVLSGKTLKGEPPRAMLNVLESAAWGKLAAMKAKSLAADDRCVACGQCEMLCPNGNITIVNGRPSFGASCIQCLSCLQYCPQEAISMGAVTQKREHYVNPKVSVGELTSGVIHID